MKDIYIKDLREGEQQTICCWISSIRRINDHLFFDVYDSTGEIQAYAHPLTCKEFHKLTGLKKESAVELTGCVNKERGDFNIIEFKIIAASKINISPSPNQKNFNVLSPEFSKQVIEHPTFYIRNKTLSMIFYIKSVFKRELQNFFWEKSFVEFEAPTLTKQTLYDDTGAIWLNVEQQNVCLSRCATFHLEPAIVAYEKVFTITNSHADEKVKTKRLLVEYLHLKAELAWVTLDELISLASECYYEVSKATYNKCKNEINTLLTEEVIREKLEKLKPENHRIITYDEAVEILKSKGEPFEYGKSLTSRHESILTKHFNECFLWIKYIPYTVEGFMFKRLPENPYLTYTCDLIAPNGFGEILGCAEKITEYDELINSMKQKGKYKDFARYKDYADLHQFGLPPHGGIGMGIERAVRYLLNLDHVKYIKPFAVVKQTQINH